MEADAADSSSIEHGIDYEDSEYDLTENNSFGMKDVAKADSEFVPRIYSKVTSKHEGNLIMSALSIECVLAVASLGSMEIQKKKSRKLFLFLQIQSH